MWDFYVQHLFETFELKQLVAVADEVFSGLRRLVVTIRLKFLFACATSVL